MLLDTEMMISITEVNQNFSRVTRLVERHGAAVIMKNNSPRYLVIDFARANADREADDAEVQAVSRALVERSRKAYEALAK